MIQKRLDKLRHTLRNKGFKAIIIYPSDPHQSEYLTEYWKMRDWITGFTGSAGTAVITLNEAGLWTDSRYFIQAESELKGSGIKLFRTGEKGVPDIAAWLKQQLSSGDKVYWVAETISVSQRKHFNAKLEDKGIMLHTGPDIFDELWVNRPELPMSKIYEHPIEFAITSVSEKIIALRAQMEEMKADYFFTSAVDETAWLLNLRGSDVDCNPIFLSCLLLSSASVSLFVEIEKIDSILRDKLKAAGIELKPYKSVQSVVSKLTESSKIWIDPTVLNCEIYDTISCKTIESRSPVMHMKAVKNAAQIAHLQNAMTKDGIALFKAFRWLRDEVSKREVKESDFAKKIASFRSTQDHYVGESFSAIVGYKGNGAIVHYHPTPENSALIKQGGMLLVDSGGQYFDGTTDITRTIHLGSPSKEEKQNFTLVLKGMIALSLAVFPEGTSGAQLDILARQFLWKQGLNFGHGTGHGVGYFLNVHEPPQGFVPQITSERGKTILMEGMITSNEPAYYKAGEYGIRSENLIVAKSGPHNNFLHFETLTLYPFDRNLIDVSLLSSEEINWLNNYHQMVFDRLRIGLTESEQEELSLECTPISSEN